MIPMLERGHHRHVVGFEHVKAGGKNIRQLPLMHKNRCLAFAYRQLGAVFDLMALAFEPPDHRVAGVVHPMDHVDEFAREEVQNTHVFVSGQIGRYRFCPIISIAICRTIGRASSTLMPEDRRGS